MLNVLEYLENSAKSYPDKVAFSDESGSITFSGFLKNAKKIGTQISKITDKHSKPIGVVCGRNFLCLEAFFGVLESGNFYVPIDENMPKARLDVMLEKLSPELILYGKENRKTAEKIDAAYRTVEITFDNEIDEEELCKRKSHVLDIDPVYVIFTSGSTGTPKGIVISHRSVIDFIDWMSETLGYSHDDVFANQAPFYFDCSVKDLYLTLKLGATNHIIPKKLFMFPTMLVDFLNDNRVTALTWATSGFNLLSVSGIFEKKHPEYLRLVAVGGEAMLAKHLNNWRRAMPDTKFVNLYGPTEVTVDCTYYVVEREFKDNEAVPIGKACRNKEVVLLNSELQPVEKGKPGEIVVRGIGLSKGYYNEPEKTEAVFVNNPNTPYNDWLYRTGDIGKEDSDGNIVFQSRIDGQIKHMGYRIELGEIERAVSCAEGIETGVCFFDKERDRIVLCYCGESDEKEIVKSLSGLIPKYMFPNIYRKYNQLPKTANGKIDRVTLRKDYDDEENN